MADVAADSVLTLRRVGDEPADRRRKGLDLGFSNRRFEVANVTDSAKGIERALADLVNEVGLRGSVAKLGRDPAQHGCPDRLGLRLVAGGVSARGHEDTAVRRARVWRRSQA